jgi:hypothetical protein
MDNRLDARTLDARTLELARNDAADALDGLEQRVDHLDTKIAAVFGVGAVIAGIVPAIEPVQVDAKLACLIVAIVAWVFIAALGIHAFGPVGWRMFRPEKLLTDHWVELDAQSYELYRLEYIVEQYADNLSSYRKKRGAFSRILVALVIEVLALTLFGALPT